MFTIKIEKNMKYGVFTSHQTKPVIYNDDHTEKHEFGLIGDQPKVGDKTPFGVITKITESAGTKYGGGHLSNKIWFSVSVEVEK